MSDLLLLGVGDRPTAGPGPGPGNAILQENAFYILQEDGVSTILQE